MGEPAGSPPRQTDCLKGETQRHLDEAALIRNSRTATAAAMQAKPGLLRRQYVSTFVIFFLL
jgi:hypothetical protein